MCIHNNDRNEMFFQTKFKEVFLKKFEKYNQILIKKIYMVIDFYEVKYH